MTDTNKLWKFPGAISDWLQTGHKELSFLKQIEGTSPYTKIQTEFQRISNSSIDLISIRKKIKGYEKIGFLILNPRLSLTYYGNEYVCSQTENERRIILRNSLLNIKFWNPTEKNMDGDFDIYPFKSTLYLLLKLRYLTKLETGNKLICVKKDSELDEIIIEIKEKRTNNEEYPFWYKEDGRTTNASVNNTVQHMFSLYSSTDFVIKQKDKIFINPDKLNEVKELFENVEDIEGSDSFISPSTERITYTARILNEQSVSDTPIVRRNTLYSRDNISLERSNRAHTKLINDMITKLKNSGFDERKILQTNHIDLFVDKNNKIFLCEMKSLNNTNQTSQIRKGISQLLEYEYFDLVNERKTKEILKFLILEKKPDINEYINFIRYCNIYILWKEEDDLVGNSESINLFNLFIE